jgi:coproporphyrinogen III oxidase
MDTKSVIQVGAAAGLALGLYQVYINTKPKITETPIDHEQRAARQLNPFMMRELITGPLSDTPTTAESMENLISRAQKDICAGLPINLEEWKIDCWMKPGNTGGGCSCVVQQNKDENPNTTNVFEKAGVNVSVVSGSLTEAASRSMTTNHPGLPKRKEDGTLPFKAMGISSVLHPHNPHAPTLHFNFRYFEVTGVQELTKQVTKEVTVEVIDEETGEITEKTTSETTTETTYEPKMVAWFGGGIDLTPSYLYPEDIIHFHSTLKKVCEKHNYPYQKFKVWCDNYFVNKHRNDERRGVGGVFFDDIDDRPQGEILKFIEDMTKAVLDCYLPILERRKDQSFTQAEKTWQSIRRGRYVEFNIVYDRGTKFGLMTPGSRIESILVSLPRYASWEYCHDDEIMKDENSREAELLKVCREPKDWVK